MTGLRKLLDRHRAASLLAGIALVAALFPAGPFGVRARLAGMLRPLALLQSRPPGEGSAGEDPRVREAVAGLQARIHELESENASLKEFRGLHLDERPRPARPVLANIVARDRLWPDRLSELVDRGTADGLRRGLPVMAGKSLAGFVVEVGPATARVQLLDDPAPRADGAKNPIGVRILRPGSTAAVEGVLLGVGRGFLEVRMLPGGFVKPGDIVVTSASDLSVPAGILVGTVVSVDEDRRLRLATARVTPSADIAALRTLVVLVLPEPEARPAAAGKAR